MHASTLVPRSLMGFAVVFAAAWACSETTAGDESQCRVSGSTSSDVRIQVANFANVSGVQVTIETPRGTCVINELPVQDAQGDLQLGQALFPLQVDDVVTFFLTGGAALIKSCKTTAIALQNGNADVGLQSVQSLTCDGFAFIDP